MATFGERLRELREKAGIKQKDLAVMIGVSKVTLNRWENENQTPKIEIAYDIYNMLADIFDVTYAYITCQTDDCKPYDYGSDEEAAKQVIDEERNLRFRIIRMYFDLSPEMKAMVGTMLGKAYRIDKERGRLLSQQEDPNTDSELDE